METCKTCGHPVLTQVWVAAKAAVKESPRSKTVLEEAIPGHWKPLPYPQTPLGNRHDCDEARKRWEPMRRALTGEEELFVC